MTSSQFNRLLMQSARLGNYSQVVNALKRGAQVDATDAEGTTALMFAAQRGATQIVDLLIATGADVDIHRRHFGTTALMFAAAANRAPNCWRHCTSGCCLTVIGTGGRCKCD